MKIRCRDRKKHAFTLVELIVAMAVFAVLMLALMQTFSATQNVTTRTSAKTNTYAGARLFLDNLTTELQTAYYLPHTEGVSFFVSKNSTASWVGGDYLWFVASKPYSLSALEKDSRLVELKYVLESVPSTDTNPKAGPFRFKISVDKEFSAAGTRNSSCDFRTATNAYTTTSATSDIVLENVVEFKMSRAMQQNNTLKWNTDVPQTTLPHLIFMELKVIDPEDFDAYNRTTDSDRKTGYIRTFTRIVAINRGQVY